MSGQELGVEPVWWTTDPYAAHAAAKVGVVYGDSWQRLRAQIDEHLKPTVEEPTEFGSVVRAGIDGISDRVLWLRSASGYWFSETSRRATFSDLHHPEVVRVGVGGVS